MSFVIDTYGMPSDAELRMPGCVGASRYVSHESSKTVTRAQVDHIHSLDRVVDLNFEDSATNAKGGQPQGVTDGRFFVAEARGVRAPAGVAGYASVDYEVHGGGALTVAENYFRGWTPVLHDAGYLSGAYGDYDLLVALLGLGLIDLGWQTVAWSYGKRLRDPRACLLQDQFTQGYDVDEIENPFWGAWTPTGAQPNPREDPLMASTLSTEVQKQIAAIVAANNKSLVKALTPETVALEAIVERDHGCLFVKFPDAPTASDAIYLVSGGVLVWLQAPEYKALGSPEPVPLAHATSTLYSLPVAAGTPDPRGAAS